MSTRPLLSASSECGPLPLLPWRARCGWRTPRARRWFHPSRFLLPARGPRRTDPYAAPGIRARPWRADLPAVVLALPRAAWSRVDVVGDADGSGSHRCCFPFVAVIVVAVTPLQRTPSARSALNLAVLAQQSTHRPGTTECCCPRDDLAVRRETISSPRAAAGFAQVPTQVATAWKVVSALRYWP